MTSSLPIAHWKEHTEYLMLEADCLLESADHESVVSFDDLMKVWEELGLSFAERLELAVEKLRGGSLPDASRTGLHLI